MSGAVNSNAAEIISENCHHICEAITSVSSITWFSQKLEGAHLISPQAKMEILGISGLSNIDKCDQLLNAVKVQVRADPSKIFKFLEILQCEAALQNVLQSFADAISTSLIHRELTMHFFN